MTRKKFDFYQTPTDMTKDLIDFYSASLFEKFLDTEKSIFEPCVGDFALLNSFIDFYSTGNVTTKFITNDIVEKYGKYSLDMTLPESWEKIKQQEGVIDLVITNPPFSDAFKILRNAYAYSTVGVIMLLRLTFLEPTGERKAWLQEYPPSFLRIYGSPRPKFTEKGTDTVTTAWVGWIKHPEIDVYSYHKSPISFASDWRN